MSGSLPLLLTVMCDEMDRITELREMIRAFGSGPLLEEMPGNTLQDKGIAGPTAAHRIEEIHTPLNFSYITCTTGSSAFQNIVGVTQAELPARIAAGREALARCGLGAGDTLVVTYPPLVNVFTRQALDEAGISVRFICRPSRDALVLELCAARPRAVLGESSFLRAALVDARRLGLWGRLPDDLIVIAAGTPLDPELGEQLSELPGSALHDLYGCQEFGWLVLDGVPLREDIVLWDSGRPDRRKALLAGGLPTGDWFLTGQNPLNPQGKILTQSGVRGEWEPEVTILSTTLSDPMTAARVARSILRIKAKIVRLSPALQCGQPQNRLMVQIPGEAGSLTLEGPEQTRLFDDLVEAQKQYQREEKTDPVWNKVRV